MTDTMQMPASFKYRDVFLKGRPIHEKNSPFYAKHPPMPPSRWAKIFNPFDALAGFSDAIKKTAEAASSPACVSYRSNCLDKE